MTLGLQEAGRRLGRTVEVTLAVDIEAELLAMFELNLGARKAIVGDVAGLFDGALGSAMTPSERALRALVGRCDVLVGGPPCQGHSDLNNHTRRHDPRNTLLLRMARAAEVLDPFVVVVENVAPATRDSSDVVAVADRVLSAAGYKTAQMVIDLRRVGVPQRRRRFLLMASKRSVAAPPAEIMTRIVRGRAAHPDRTVGWAIQDLLDQETTTLLDTPSRLSVENRERIAYLFARDLYDLPNSQRPPCHRNGGHSYVSMYGRLCWDQPAQTITTGFGSPGQGRYIHPLRPRTITPHEAARLQTFPDWFRFPQDLSRGLLATAIGNAVPPLLTVELGLQVLPAIPVR